VSLTSPELVLLAQRLSSFSESTTEMLKSASSSLASPQEHPTTSLLPSGNTSLKANPSTSTRSCLLSTGLQLLRTGRHKLEKQIYLLDRLKLQERSRLQPTGLPRGDEQQERQLTRSHTGAKKWRIMPSISRMSSPLKTRRAITKSSSTMSQLETSSAEDNTYCSPIHTSSYPFTQ
jgi:hypothetical protein